MSECLSNRFVDFHAFIKKIQFQSVARNLKLAKCYPRGNGRDYWYADCRDVLCPMHWFASPQPNANIQRRPLRSEAEKRPSGGGPSGPERTGMTCYMMDTATPSQSSSSSSIFRLFRGFPFAFSFGSKYRTRSAPRCSTTIQCPPAPHF